MRNILLILIALLFACNQQTENKTKDSLSSDSSSEYTDNEKSDYNPKVDSVYYYPSDSNIASFDTFFNNHKIEFNILPIPDKYVVSYSEYLDNTSEFRKDKILYRDYKLQIKIAGNNNILASRQIDKNEFADILKPNPDNYFIRDVKFMGLDKDEFRFDIKICFLDRDEPGAIIKYYIKGSNDFRHEDFPKSFYDSIYPELDFDNN